MKDKDHLENPQNVLFADLLKICQKYFGKPITGCKDDIPWQLITVTRSLRLPS
jgi:hypothetical protein